MSEFRPIALCNLLYKFTAKVLASRLKSVVDLLVSENQSAFIHRRSITDNIFLCNEIVRGYDRESHSLIALMKIDIHKAFKSIRWDYIGKLVEKMGFSLAFIH
ncbi:uncharacterized protein LOC122650189 [Telopea speciosissima]|uniref:uncharacterized protein LOC122650189 n=1 Tax=Telopea speciosissima TaxID=54955 RepID=UPI001CC6AB2A|nr:uncharacterized protein LOC122650189 [Telopea speciosissima]